MIPMLAQIPTATAAEINTVLVGGAAVLAMLYLGIQVWKSLTSGIKESPIPIDTYAKIAECELRHSDLNRRLSDIQSNIADNRKEWRIDVAGIHDRINGVSDSISDVSGQISQLSKRVK